MNLSDLTPAQRYAIHQLAESFRAYNRLSPQERAARTRAIEKPRQHRDLEREREIDSHLDALRE